MENILFILSDAIEPRNANVNVVMALARQFRKKYKVYALASYADNEKLIKNLDEYFDLVIPFCIMTQKSENKERSFIKKSRLIISRNIRKLYSNKIEDICEKHKINIMIGATNPYLVSELISESNNSCKKVLIQLDPFTLNHTLPQDCIRKVLRRIRENYCYSQMDKIFICDFQYDEYVNDVLSARNKKYEKSTHKVFAIQLPGILTDYCINETDRDYETVVSLKEGISFAFIGRFYEDIRNPCFLLELFRHLPSEYHLHLIGGGCENIVVKYIPKLKNRLHLHGWIEKAEANAIMMSCDFLVNLNNNINNQMPSKVFEYIGTGKPILNICHDNTCPTIKILNGYNNSINIIEKEGFTVKTYEQIGRFVFNNKNHKELKEEILERYHQYTDEAVAEFMMSKI